MKVKRLPTDRNSTDASLADPFKPIMPNFDFLDNPTPTPTRFKSRNLSSLRQQTPLEPTPPKSRSLSNRKYAELIRKDVHVNHCGKGEGRVVPTPKIKSHLRDFSYCWLKEVKHQVRSRIESGHLTQKNSVDFIAWSLKLLEELYWKVVLAPEGWVLLGCSGKYASMAWIMFSQEAFWDLEDLVLKCTLS